MHNIRYSYVIYPLAVGVFLAWVVTGYFYTAGSPVENRAAEKHMPKRGADGPDIGLIEAKNIFHAETSTVKSTLDAVDFMPSSQPAPAAVQSDIKLMGILKGPYTSYAIVKFNNDNLLLKQGTENNGLKLKSATDTEAEIEKDGRVLKLAMDSAKSETVQQSGGNPNRTSITRREVTEKLSSVNKVMKTVFISPFERDGKFIGYRMNKLKPDSTLAKMGLMNGDVVIRLNGKELKDPAIFFDALSNAENLSALTLDIERNQQKKTLYVEIK